MTLEERVYSNDYADLIVRSFYLEVYQNAVHKRKKRILRNLQKVLDAKVVKTGND